MPPVIPISLRTHISLLFLGVYTYFVYIRNWYRYIYMISIYNNMSVKQIQNTKEERIEFLEKQVLAQILTLSIEKSERDQKLERNHKKNYEKSIATTKRRGV